jgi:hypothetical protein
MKKLLKKILILLPIPTLVLATTWIVDPANIKSDDSYEKGVASILLSGNNVANLVNFRERMLQKEIVLGLSKAPDVIVLGSSRSMAIDSTFFHSKFFLNNSVSGASIEDYLGIFYLYLERGLKPKFVIIGLDPWVLNRNNDQNRWEDLSDGYFKMKSILGFTSLHTANVRNSFLNKICNYKNYKEFISPAYFNQSFLDLIKKGHTGNKYWSTDKSEAEVPIKRADGSYAYDKKMRGKNLADINRDAKVFAMANPMYSLGKFNKLDQSTMQLLDSFINYLTKNDVRVIIFLPPYHPAVFESIKVNTVYSMVAESEKWYRSLAIKHKSGIVGSYDPNTSNLKESDFYDGMHPKNQAVHRMFDAAF